jgi:integration host factor subunit beta
MPVTKSDLIEQLSESLKLPKGKAELVVNVMFDSMVAALQRGERIEIRGFGSFEVRNYKPYEGRNPRTGEPVHVKAKRLPFFKVGKELRERVNAGTHPIEVDHDDDDVVSDDEMGGDQDGDEAQDER